MATCRANPIGPLLSPPLVSRMYGSASSFKFAGRPSIRFHLLRSRAPPVFVVAAQSNFLRVVQTAIRVGNDIIGAGTNFVPESVPRPIAKIGVGIFGVSFSLFLLKSVISTAFFVLAMMGLIYFAFIALNSDEGPKGDKNINKSNNISTEEESLEEARRIMEKYK